MKRLILFIFCCIMLTAFASFAAEGKALSDIHKASDITCADCHGKMKKITVDDNEVSVNSSCVSCHGGMEEMAKLSHEEINPHASHLGDINCTTCHKGHEKSQPYCLKCHSFPMVIPGSDAPEKKWTEYDPKAKITRTETTDVVVIGAGAAGMTAAINAFDAGVKVIVIEKMPLTGGNSMLAAGGMNAAETVFQKKKGIDDSVQLMYEDTMKGGKYMNVPALAEVLAKNSSSSIDWLTSVGADMSDVGRMAGASVYRTHRPTGGKVVGAHIAIVLRNNAKARNMDVRLNTKAEKLIVDEAGNVTGIIVQGKHSGTYAIKAKAVVLAAGGFSANASRVAHYKPEFAGMTTSNQPGAQGEGMVLGAKIGAEMWGMDQIQIHPTVAAGSRILITEAVRGNGAILVNYEGKRFVNELTTRDKASAAILAQTNKSAFLVFDDNVRKSLKQIDGYFHLDLVKTGNTPAELAKAMGVPADALEATIKTYNDAVSAKSDKEFGRPDLPRDFKTAPYIAIEVRPGIHYTMGGLLINTDAQVMSIDGTPIGNLYAAGEVTGGVHGGNRLGGNSISETITFGRIAGTNAANLVKSK
ncbi:MAG TPA: flavocytochrome c [Deferribacteraceae bacterium]|nr:flavocytochrome c [Deferribacteraceae bacterium]